MRADTESKLTPKQHELFELMSEISEDCYCAGWMMGLENAIWGALQDGDLSYGMGEMDSSLLERVRALHVELGGWIVWKDDDIVPDMPSDEWGPYFVTTEDWLRQFMPFVAGKERNSKP